MHTLAHLINIWKENSLWLEGESEKSFDYLSSDTRRLPKDKKLLFFARRGSLYDGHQFLSGLGSKAEIQAFILERRPENLQTNADIILVRDTKLAMALAAKELYGDPSRKLFCCAVTGTNGKTTSSFLIKHWLESRGKATAIAGTVMTGFKNEMKDSELTTPDFSDLQSFLSDVSKKSAEAFVFEASSHALDQGRLLGIEVDAAIFTNLSTEHLDYHPSMEDYFIAKKKLFSEMLYKSSKPQKIAVCPADGAYGARLLEELKPLESIKLVSWGFTRQSPVSKHLEIRSWETSLDGSRIEFVWDDKAFEVKSRLVGKFNIENIAGVVALGLAAGDSFSSIQSSVGSFQSVPGRLQSLNGPHSSKVFVDYAHTPDALENVLSTLRPLCKGKLVIVFGCGGDRDRSKRPLMAQTAELYADHLFLTSDNPRNEKPTSIIEEMLSGLQKLKTFEVEPDRKLAIQKALNVLDSEDVLLIAGKGHEKYQQIGQEKLDFDDVKVVREFLG